MRVPRCLTLFIVPAVLLATLAAHSASAQCFGPDLLDVGTCCQAVVPSLPAFPQASMPSLGICWTQCTVNTTNPLKVSWTPPTQPLCTEYVTQLSVSDGTSGAPLLSGTMVLNYTRTWMETNPAGTATQVWRFTAKADLASVTTGAPPCPVPNCIAPVGPHPTAFYYGYVDYAGCTAAGGFDNSIVLYHNCDRFIHMAGLSDKPGTFHPSRSFAIVGPHSALQPFIPMNQIAPGGALLGEASRNVRTPGAIGCIVEDHVLNGALNPMGAGCVCTLSTVPKQQSLRQFTGQNFCANTAGVPGGWASLNVAFPTLPWMHMVSTSMGAWSNPNVYPGKESAWADEGLFVHQDPCNGDFIELKYGGTTRDGWMATTQLGVVTKFTDIADNFTAPLMGPYPSPILGSIRPTDHLIYVNQP